MRVARLHVGVPREGQVNERAAAVEADVRTGTQRSDGGKTSAARVIARGWHRNRTRHLSCRVDPSFCDATPTGGGDDDEREQPEECAETRVAVASTGHVRRRYEATRFASFTAAPPPV